MAEASGSRKCFEAGTAESKGGRAEYFEQQGKPAVGGKACEVEEEEKKPGSQEEDSERFSCAWYTDTTTRCAGYPIEDEDKSPV